MTTQRKRAVAIVALIIVAAAGTFGLVAWKNRSENSRENLLSILPTDGNVVAYVDLVSLRQSTILDTLKSLAPQSATDQQYARFKQDTSFDYERDLDQLAVAIEARGGSRHFFIVADGRFNKKKIVDYAMRTGRKETHAGREAYHVPASADSGEISFVFLNAHRIALTNDATVGEQLYGAEKSADHGAWTTRFDRLAGSPIFVLLRQDAATGQAIVEQTPGGLHSPQLAALLGQLDWISLAGRPAGTRLRVVAEGESANEATTRQLSEFLGGALVLAQAGLSDPKLRTQMTETSRGAILDLLKSADVSRVDRGSSKSVRVVFEVAPELLELAASTPLRVNSSSPQSARESAKPQAKQKTEKQ